MGQPPVLVHQAGRHEGLVDVGRFEARVVQLAVEDRRIDGRAGRYGPQVVCRQRRCAAVRVGDFHLHPQLRHPVPARGDGYQQHVLLRQVVFYVVGGVVDPLVITALGRVQHMVADLAVVDVHFVVTQPGDIQPGFFDLFLLAERSFEIDDPAGFSGYVRDPVRYPILFVEQSHFERSRRRPVALSSVGCPDAYFPVVAFLARECGAFVADARRSGRFDSAAVPNAVVLCQFFLRPGDDDLVSGL